MSRREPTVEEKIQQMREFREKAKLGGGKERIEKLEGLMTEAAQNLEFEKAAAYRDELKKIKKRELEIGL